MKSGKSDWLVASVKCSDDSAVAGCVSGDQENEYRELVDRFVAWCRDHHLLLNVTETKGTVTDFRRNHK